MNPRAASRAEAAVLVVGAGPAGLFAAIRAAEVLRVAPGGESAKRGGPGASGPRASDGVVVLERRERPARKLLLSGSGQCNLTHAGPIEEFPPRYGRAAAGRFLKHALYDFTNEDLLDWFRARGLDFITEEGGKVFPASRRASEILAVLLAECARLGIRLETGLRVESVARMKNEGGGFLARATRQAGAAVRDAAARDTGAAAAEFRAPVLLLATGGASYPATGSSGDGYAFALSLGHRVVPARPALAPVRVRGFALSELAGLSFRGAGLSIRRRGKRVASFEGDLLVTHDGFSGPLVLDASRDIVPGDGLEIRFAPEGAREFRDRLDEEAARSPRSLVKTVLAQAGLPRSLAERFAELAGIGPEERAADLRREKRVALCALASAFPAEVDRPGDFDEAMATSGGVELAEVDPKTMESRIVPGLFFAGELLDVDGDTGGYNLQAAFSTGSLAAKGMIAALP